MGNGGSSSRSSTTVFWLLATSKWSCLVARPHPVALSCLGRLIAPSGTHGPTELQASAAYAYTSTIDPRTEQPSRLRLRILFCCLACREALETTSTAKAPIHTQSRHRNSMAGFDFSNHNRNAALHAQGVPLPKATSTGTTIVGCLFDGGVVIAADTRATSGPIVADKVSIYSSPCCISA